jgi:hypothetical protein
MHRTSTTSTASPADQTTITGGAMTIAQFCRWACVGRTKLYSEIKAGRIMPRKLGSKTVILRADAEAWLSSLPTAV